MRPQQNFRTFWLGSTAIEFVMVGAIVGLALSATLSVVRDVVVDKFEAIDRALKHQGNFLR